MTADSERHLVGPLLIALLCALSLRMRLSRRRTQEFLGDWLGLQLRNDRQPMPVHEAARALGRVVEEQLVPEVRNSELIHADETSRKGHGRLLWLWVFDAVFVIGKRSQELLYSVIGNVLTSWLISDGYRAYREYERRSRCLTHLLRKARGLEEGPDRAGQRFGKALRSTIEAVMPAVYAAREGPPNRELRVQCAEQLLAFLDLCIARSEAKHEKTRVLARELLNDWNTFWIVLEHPELPLTNNLAERALRHWVIARPISYGTPTPQGARAFTVLASMIEPCRQTASYPGRTSPRGCANVVMATGFPSSRPPLRGSSLCRSKSIPRGGLNGYPRQPCLFHNQGDGVILGLDNDVVEL